MTKPREERQQVTFQGTHDWTRSEIQVEGPPESMHILFGISLTGKGHIWVPNVQLESIPSTSEQRCDKLLAQLLLGPGFHVRGGAPTHSTSPTPLPSRVP